MKRSSLAVIGGAVVVAAVAMVAITNPIANAGESDPQRDDLKASEIRQDLSSSLGDDYAGIWVDKNGAIKVAVTDESKVDVVSDAGAEPQLVKYSKRELDQVMDVLNKRPAPATVHKWFVDPATNSVVVESREGANDEATERWLDNAVAESPAVRLVEGKNAPEGRANILGGDKWEANGPTFCSVAFPATDAGGGKHFLTAGHCFTDVDNDVVNNAGSTEQIGTYDSATDVVGDGDIAKVDLNDNQQLFGSVNLYDETVQPITGSTEVEVGAQICRSGAASGPQFGALCGVVVAKDVTVNTNFNRLGLIAVTGQTDTNICSIGGDSGGAFFSGDQAQGILSGGTGTCGVDEASTTNFTPVNKALTALGLTLLTS
jgi:streptogrisin C